MDYNYLLAIKKSTHPIFEPLTELITSEKSLLRYFKIMYYYISPKLLKLYIRLALKFFNSLEGFINKDKIELLFQLGLEHSSITKEYAYYCILLKEYDFFLKYKRRFEKLDKELFKGGK